MQKKNLIKSCLVVALLMAASMFGFKQALGYGGGGGGYVGSSPCVSVVYADWQNCTSGIQWRNVVSQIPSGCVLTASQQLDRSRTCGAGNNGEVLGTKVYAVGSLLRTPDNKIYVVLAGNKVKHIKNLVELWAYRGLVINEVSNETLAQYSQVLGAKVYGEGALLRSPDMKIYVVVGGKLKHIVSMAEFKKYGGRYVYNVSEAVIKSFEIVK
jgi:hypothetical protein